MRFDRTDWNRAFFKVYYERRSFGNLLVSFNRIWVIHISFGFYTAYNVPTIYQPQQRLGVRLQPSS
jgi:1,3-beta-glucan synthase